MRGHGHVRIGHAFLGSLLGVMLCSTLVQAQAANATGQANDSGQGEAKTHFELGQRHYQAGEFQAAIAEFTRAYELLPLPELQYNIARSHEQLGDLHHAIDAFERYLRASPDASDADEVRARIEWLRTTRDALEDQRTEEAARGALRVVSPTGIAVGRMTLDGEPLSTDAIKNVVWVAPGRHRLVVYADERTVPFQADVSVRASGLTAARVTFLSTDRVTDGTQGAVHSAWPIALAAVGAAALVTGAALSAASTGTTEPRLDTAAQASWIGAASLLTVAACVHAFE